MATLGLILLVLGTLLYQQFAGFLCFDYCGAAQDYASHALVGGVCLLGPGAVATVVAFGLLLR
jgi:hypothetical protein